MRLVDQFVAKVIQESDYEKEDSFYLKNRVLALVGQEALNAKTESVDLIALKDDLVETACLNSMISGLTYEKEILGAILMDFVTPIPSRINHQFWISYNDNPKQAISDFYDLCRKNDYIKLAAISKNIAFNCATDYGDLEITINLSKPEKDPKEIALAKQRQTIDYPKCQLCFENEGYEGRIDHPARANHRIIRFDLEGEEWGFQYSPYAYFNEHCIFLNHGHIPMVMSQLTFRHLLTIVDTFPDYFAGSNADLPIVGGSILTHNHYQGGRHQFPMEKAPIEREFHLAGFPNVKAGIVKWPMSVIRLQGENKEELIAFAEKIHLAWKGYSDLSVDIVAISGEEEHHTVTPIARKKNGIYELDLVLRDNHTSQEFPDGIYHPHQDVQHIKKENIGLIEVMGLAILPPRLKDELKEVENYLLNRYNEIADYHKEWAERIKFGQTFDEDTVTQFVQDEVGKVFARVLEDAGVYKRDTVGQEAFWRFIKYLEIVEE